MVIRVVKLFSTTILPHSDVKNEEYDALVVVASKAADIPFDEIKKPVAALLDVDPSAEGGVFVVPSSLPSKKIIFSGTGPLDKDYDDVRLFAEAAEKGIKKALDSGSKSPLLFVKESSFAQANLVSLLGALKAAYVPLETRESVKNPPLKVKSLGIISAEEKIWATLELMKALEAGRIVSRDIGGSDPERMAAPRVEEYIHENFGPDSKIKIEVIKGQKVFEEQYPCLAAVNRCSQERHEGRVIWMTYEPEDGREKVTKTLMLVGKGITYDTGGADVKAGGVMAGMSRDKCGAADVAGIMKVVSILKPKNIKVVAALAFVRNSVGSNSYVSDEIITARSGVRIRVGNTDAEGRMVMVDLLCHMKELALKEKNPHLMTIATLTGHAVLAVGPYNIIMDNGPAKKEGCAQAIQQTGEEFGDPFEISTIRREDWEFCKDKSGKYVDILQCNNAPSSRTPRGHQFPAAFMHTVSGLDKHMLSSEKPLKYSHLDVAGSSGELPDPPTASAVVALAMHFFGKKWQEEREKLEEEKQQK